jgi:CheY-like chemotaxis protein
VTTLVVADDDPLQLKLAVRRLELAGFTVIPAVDGAQALALIRTAAPDVVVSDVVMPNLDGFRLSEELRADAALAHIPVLLITNSSLDPADRMLAKRAGARDLIVRTPDFADVITAIEALTSRA